MRKMLTFTALPAAFCGLALLLTSCCWGQPESKLEPKDLEGTWTPTSITSDKKLEKPATRKAELVFKTVQQETKQTAEKVADNRVYGCAGINRFFGKYELSGGNGLKLGPLGMTRMAGAPADMAYEDAFVNVLNNTASATVSEKGLTLFDKDGKVLATFVPVSAKKAAAAPKVPVAKTTAKK